jgi:SsrA-binding protein
MTDSTSDRLKAQKYVTLNRRARRDYFVEDSFEAGIILTGTEVKVLRLGQASLQDAFAGEKDGQLYLMNAYIPEYKQAGAHLQHETHRPRALLLHKREKERLMGSIRREGITLVPLGIYFNRRGIAKVQMAIAKGKKQIDKREAIKERDWQRDRARILKHGARE